MSNRFFESEELAEALASVGPGSAERIYGLIRGTSGIPLRGLVSGSLDLDKMEYLRRDALFCGVPFGVVDVDRLIQALTLLPDPETGLYEVGVLEKAVAALESVLFAKYQMFRNVYWHHGVRAASALYKRIVEEAVRSGIITSDELVGPTDEELLHDIDRRAGEMAGSEEVADRLVTRWLPALRNRRLPKRAVELTAADLEGTKLAEWVALDSPERRRAEDELAAELDLQPGEVFIDYPLKSAMFHLDLLLQRRSGEVERLGPAGLPGVIDLPRLAQELYTTARVLFLRSRQ